MRNSSLRFVPTTLGLTGLLAFAGCGPVAIGAGLSSAGGGGGSTVSAPTLTFPSLGVQPFDTMTVFEARFTQPEGRPVRVKAFFQEGGGTRQPLSSTTLMAYVNQAPTALVIDGNGEFQSTTDAGGASNQFVWDHLAATGKPEVRDARIIFEFRDPELDGVAPSTEEFQLGTVGRDAADLENGTVTRASTTSNESAFVLAADYLDWADDAQLALTSWQFEYNLDPGAGGTWAPVVGAQAPTTIGPETLTSTGRTRRPVTFQLDPLALSIPFGDYPNLVLRANPVETFNESSRFPLAAAVAGNAATATPANAAVGDAPEFRQASIRDPLGAFSADPGRPWFNLPITLQMEARSSVPVETTFRGEYRLSGQTAFQPMTLVQGDREDTRLTRTFAPNKPTSHFLNWNVLRDVGLGVRAGVLSAETRIFAQVVPTSGPGQALARETALNITNIITSPFADFRTALVRPGETFASSAQFNSTTTRDVFLSQIPQGAAQEQELLLDQQFRARQIPLVGSLNTSGLSNNGITRILPTDFRAGVPDCVVELADNQNRFFFVEWPDDPAGPNDPLLPVRVDLNVVAGGGSTSTPSAAPVQFDINGKSGAVFIDYRYDAFNNPTVYTIRVNLLREVSGVIRAVAREFDYASPLRPVDPGNAGSPRFLDSAPRLVAIEQSGNSFEFVVGNVGAEYSATAGVLHSYRILDNGATLEIDSSSTRLPSPPVPLCNGDRFINGWFLESWRPDNGDPNGLVLVRDLNGITGQCNKEFEVLTLSRAGGSFANAWQPLTTLAQSTLAREQGFDGANLQAVFAADIDSNFGGFPGSDLLLIFTNKESGVAPRTDKFQAWIYSQSVGQFRNAVPLTAPATPGSFNAEFQLVDVNGDSAIDLLVKDSDQDPNGTTRDPSGWTYLPSALTGVSAGFGDVNPLANGLNVRSRRPAVIDLDSDGQQDILTGGILYNGRPDGQLEQRINLTFPGGGLASNQPGANYSRTGLFLDPPADSMEFVIQDADRDLRELVMLSAPDGNGARTLTRRTLPVPAAGFRGIGSLVTPETATTRVQDLIVRAPDVGNESLVYRGRYDSSSDQFVLDAAPIFATPTRAALTIRRGEIPQQLPSQMSTQVEDLILYISTSVTGTGDELVWLDSQNNYQPTTLFSYPVTERIASVRRASISTDFREDLVVLTQIGVGADRVYRLYAFLQTSAGFPGGGLTPIVELLRFQPGYQQPTIRGIGFDDNARSLARGLLLLDNAPNNPSGGEVRIVQPFDAGGSLAARIIRSPLKDPIEAPISLIVTDNDGDGLIEVISGTNSANPAPRGLRKLDRGFSR